MNNRRYFSTKDFKEGLCKLEFDAYGENEGIELMMPTELWSFINSKTTQIVSVDIETHDNKIVISFVDIEPGTNTARANNPYSLTVSVEQTNLVPRINTEQNFVVYETGDLATKIHTLKVYTEDSEEPVAVFKNVKAFRYEKQITVNHIERYITY